jgi:Cof subfamily protein (haloacid dehalogenase superfamily)
MFFRKRRKLARLRKKERMIASLREKRVKVSIKMIVTDLDCTLLRTDKTVSVRTAEVLRNCRESGIKVVYATARGRSAESLVPSELFDGFVIANGALVYADETEVSRCLIPHETARPILLACHGRGLNTAAVSGDMHYSNFNIWDIWPGFLKFQIADFFTHEIDSEKICIDAKNQEDIDFLESILPEGVYQYNARDMVSMIMNKEATKAKGVEALAEYWKIDKNEIVVFGDDENDIDMFNWVWGGGLWSGTAVAMENALPKVKTAAKQICMDNDSDGVAEWIVKNVKNYRG